MLSGKGVVSVTFSVAESLVLLLLGHGAHDLLAYGQLDLSNWHTVCQEDVWESRKFFKRTFKS